jgi:hypothetical protein
MLKLQYFEWHQLVMEPWQGVAVQQRLEFPLEDITNHLFDIIVF